MEINGNIDVYTQRFPSLDGSTRTLANSSKCIVEEVFDASALHHSNRTHHSPVRANLPAHHAVTAATRLACVQTDPIHDLP